VSYRLYAVFIVLLIVTVYVGNMAVQDATSAETQRYIEAGTEWCEEKVGGEAYVAMAVLDGVHCALPPDKATFWNRSVDIPPASELNTTR
jgi:hypothetical protein